MKSKKIIIKKRKILEQDFDQETLHPIDIDVEEDLESKLEELTEGDDPVEMDILEGDKIVYGSSFSPMDGDEGDESEDIGDLPDEMKGDGHRYDPTLGSGGRVKDSDELEEWEDGLFVTTEDDLGFGYGDNDYSNEEGDLY